MNNRFLYILTGLAIINPIMAENSVGNVKTTASIVASCVIKSEDLSFGTISLVSDTFANANITSLCTKGTVYKVGVDAGTGSAGITNLKYSVNGYSRFMIGKNSNDKIAYNVFQDMAHTKIFGGFNAWGGGQGMPVVVNLIGTGSNQITPMYGALPPQFVTPDNYLDSNTVSIQF